MVGYNVLEMYLRAIGIFLAFKSYVEKNEIRRTTFQWGGGGVKKSATPGPLLKIFLKPFLRQGLKKPTKLQTLSELGGGVREIPPVSEPIF